jgi:hypothetical protein
MSSAHETIEAMRRTSEQVNGWIEELDMTIAMLAAAVGPEIMAEYLRILADEVAALPRAA